MNPDQNGTLWVVVEAESRPGVLGGTELLAIERLREAGIETYWPHYSHLSPPRHIGDWRGRQPVTVLRGYYAPWFFVAVRDDPADDVARIKDTRYVADVLWTETDRHYLESWWLDWLKSDRPHPDGKPWPRPVCVEPHAGLFEPPSAAEIASRRLFAAGDLVRTRGAWAEFEAMVRPSVVVSDTGKTIRVDHGEMLGKRVLRDYDPSQVDPA